MSPPATTRSASTPPADLRPFYWAVTLLLLAYAFPLFELVRFSLHSELYSYIVLIPFVSLYFVWLQRSTLPIKSSQHRPLAAVFFAIGLVVLAAYIGARSGYFALAQIDRLALSALSLVFFLTGLCAWKLGVEWLRALAFPLAFLLFMIPLPVFVETAVETFLQHGSAAVALVLFKISGTTVFAEGLSFQLPGITLQVAPECSGIHSSLALFITSIATARLFLRTNSRRCILALAVIPLALLRNGFRVFIIGELCVHVGPEMIHSYIHRKGGPIFFALSLVPFFLLLLILLRSERKALAKRNLQKS